MKNNFLGAVSAENAAKNTKKLRTRFAPSPTGFMHLGGLRTALYAYLFAKKNNGTFILRIEDTDQERLVEGASELIFDTLKSAGIFYDEGPDVGGNFGPYVQSERREIYQKYIEILLQKGGAYPCFCTKDELDEQRSLSKASRVPYKYNGRCALLSRGEIEEKKSAGEPFVIRQKIPREGVTFFHDAVFGRVEVENSTLDDHVLMKSDGMPTYNFANVVDDHLMEISHIIRGSEFLSSTPKYILLYKSFGWDAPEFIHCSPIMRDASSKLSKRDGDAYFSDFVEKGYLIEAILNYIALLGWSPVGEETKFSLGELEKIFDVKGISKDASIFDYKNLNSLNGAYIRSLSDEEFHARALPFIKKSSKREIDTMFAAKILKERCNVLSEIPELLDFVDELPEFSPELFDSIIGITHENAKEILTQILAPLENTSDWTQENIREILTDAAEKIKIKPSTTFGILREALTGKKHTPGGGIVISILLGKTETIRRIKTGIERVKLASDYKNQAFKKIRENADSAQSLSVEEKPANKNIHVETLQINKPALPQKSPREKLPLTEIAEIERIAALAKLDVSLTSKKLREEIIPIMEFLDELKFLQLPEKNFSPNTELENIFREDVGRARTRDETLRERDLLMANAPEIEAGCISVPKILARED